MGGYKRPSYVPVHKNLFELQPELRQDITKVEKSIRLIRKRRRRRGISIEVAPDLAPGGQIQPPHGPQLQPQLQEDSTEEPTVEQHICNIQLNLRYAIQILELFKLIKLTCFRQFLIDS